MTHRPPSGSRGAGRGREEGRSEGWALGEGGKVGVTEGGQGEARFAEGREGAVSRVVLEVDSKVWDVSCPSFSRSASVTLMTTASQLLSLAWALPEDLGCLGRDGGP